MEMTEYIAPSDMVIRKLVVSPAGDLVVTLMDGTVKRISPVQ